MKFVSTIALGIALTLGVTTVAAVQPAHAAKKAKAPDLKLTPAVRAAVAAAQEAVKAGDTATAAAKIAEAKAAAQSPDDRFITGSVMYDLARTAKNDAQQGEAIDMMVASGKVPQEQLPNFLLAQGQLAYQNKQMQKAEQALDQAVKAGVTDINAYALLAEAKHQNKKSGEAVAVLEQAIARQKAAGQAIPQEWYQRGIGIAYAAKLSAETQRLTQSWLAAYPSKTNWRDSLVTFRDLNNFDNDGQLDIMRLMRAVGAMNGERDYAEYIEATYLRFPGEAKAVFDEGVAAGMIPATSRGTKEMGGVAAGRIAADKASLDKSVSTARSAATGKVALSTADAYASYRDWAKAIDLYKVALGKGGVDANLVNTRLAFAQAQSGQKDAARQTLASITGPRAGLAKYMLIWLGAAA